MHCFFIYFSSRIAVMKRTPYIIINFIFIINLSTFVFSDFGYRDRVDYRNKVKKQKIIQSQKRETAEGMTITGIISNIDLAKNVLTLIDAEAKTLTISITEVAIWRKGKETTVQALKTNQRIKVTYYLSNQEKSAQFIEIFSD